MAIRNYSRPTSFQRRGCLPSTALLITLLAVLAAILLASPATAAQSADLLRAVFGDAVVAHLEGLLFSAQDAWQQASYHLGVSRPELPGLANTPGQSTDLERTGTWYYPPTYRAPAGKAGSPMPTSSAHPTLNLDAIFPPTHPTPYPPDITQAIAQPTPDQSTASRPDYVSSALPAWPPHSLAPMGKLEGEGAWHTYIQDPASQQADSPPVAYLTYLQPDPYRPYAIVAVVAFSLERTRLGFVLGTREPDAPGVPPRTGKIPAGDLQPGRLLATFNGGFKTTHGQFGAMSGGITVLPPRDGLGTVAIYQDGQVRLGVWGSEIHSEAGQVSWRQNGPLVVHNGRVNPEIFNNSPKDWGYTVTDVSPTWRSGLGLSQDGQRLYYFAGSKLTMEALAQAMLIGGAYNAIQLDINNYWVHFVAIRVKAEQMVPEPLFPEAMRENLDRYLQTYTRDFFYVVAR